LYKYSHIFYYTPKSKYYDIEKFLSSSPKICPTLRASRLILWLPLAEAKLAKLGGLLPVGEWSQVPRLGAVPLLFAVVPLGGHATEVTLVVLEVVDDVLLEELGVVEVLGVLEALGLHGQAHHHGGETEAEHDPRGVELPAVGGLRVLVVAVAEVAVVDLLGLLEGEIAPVSGGGFLADSVQLGVLIGPLGRLREWKKVSFRVIRVAVGVLEKFSVLAQRHQVSRVVHIILLDGTGGDASIGKRPRKARR